MRRKLKARRGMTILEMLAALLIMSMVTAGGVAAASAVMSHYNRMTEAANAEILASTVIEAVSNEIRLGKVDKDNTAGGTLALEKSTFSGENAEIKLEDGKLAAEYTYEDSSGGTTTVTKQVLSRDAYSDIYGARGVLKLKELKFEVSGAGDEKTVVTFSFTVFSDYSDELWSGEVSASPMFE